MEELMKILLEIRPDVDFKNEKGLIDGEILDSFDIIAIVNRIDEEFGIEIDMEDLDEESFNSADAIYGLICKLQQEG